MKFVLSKPTVTCSTFTLLLFASAGLLACNGTESRSSVHSQASEDTSALDDELSASDLSILVPLQSSTHEDISTSAFAKTGTGMCNAPTLDIGGDDPIISQEVWQDWAKDSLLSVLPLPADAKVWQTSDLPLSQRRAQLLEDMAAIPDVDSEDLCPDPVGLSDLITSDVSLLRNAGTHVSAVQTLPAGACRYKNWHVVGARFEPCGFRAKVVKENSAAFDPNVNSEFPFEECGGAELRLVLQPFIPRADGGYGSIDMAIHAFYKLSDVQAYVDDLRKLRRVTRAALKDKSETGAHAVWYQDQKDLLIPHPGLREEMNCDSDGPQGIGPIGTEWQKVLTKHAKQSKLFKMTWMTSDNSGGNWSFGLRLVQPDDGTLYPRKLVRQEPFQIETFTLSQVSRGYPYTPFDMKMNTVDYFYREGRTDKVLSSDVAKSSVKELIDIANPDKTTFNLGGKLGASCASCHTRDQTERAVRTRSGKTHEELALLSETPHWNPPIWDPIFRTIDKRNDNNLRNFGYGPAMSISVSRRTINESEALRRVVRDYFSGAHSSPHVNTQTAPIAFEGPIEFARDIAPLLEANCGYCHTNKRSPNLSVERTAQVWSTAIVENICKDVEAWQHMPPGKDMPKREKDLIVAWAQSLNPTAEPLDCASFRNILR